MVDGPSRFLSSLLQIVPSALLEIELCSSRMAPVPARAFWHRLDRWSFFSGANFRPTGFGCVADAFACGGAHRPAFCVNCGDWARNNFIEQVSEFRIQRFDAFFQLGSFAEFGGG